MRQTYAKRVSAVYLEFQWAFYVLHMAPNPSPAPNIGSPSTEVPEPLLRVETWNPHSPSGVQWFNLGAPKTGLGVFGRRNGQDS